MYRRLLAKFTGQGRRFLFTSFNWNWTTDCRKPAEKLVIFLHAFVRGFGIETAPVPGPTINYKILFLGSDEFSIKSLDAVTKVFNKPTVKISVVVSNENNLLGKYVKKLLNSTGQKNQCNQCLISLSHWDDLKALILQKPIGGSAEFNIGVVASFGHLIPSKVINQCQLGILNVHGSLLPRWRGAAPTAAAIMSGDEVTGVSIMKIAPHRFDIGPILHRVQLPLDPHIRTPELTALLGTIGAEALHGVLNNLNKFLPVALPQDESEATKAPKLTPEMGHVRWAAMDALEIYNLFRAVSGRYKLKTSYQGRTVALDELSILATGEGDTTSYSDFYKYPLLISLPSQDLTTNFEPGQILIRNKLICVKCKCSTTNKDRRRDWIFIRKVKINQKWISATDFQNGMLSKGGAPVRFDDTLDEQNEGEISRSKA